MNRLEKFKVLEEHKNFGITFLTTKLDTKTQIVDENVTLCDFEQGFIGNCGLIAALAALSQRPEFLKEIVPKILQTSQGILLQFNMFCEGEPITVTIDDSLPFDENNCLVYANAKRKENLFLSSLFEKVFVKHACNYSYERCKATRSMFVFSCFSECMTSYIIYQIKETKRSLMDYLAFEFNNKSSIVLGICPALNYEPDKEVEVGHVYAVIDYNNELKAIKLYDPRCNPKFKKLCISNTNLPFSLTENVDPNKGELWVTMDQLEKRRVAITSLHSKNMYKSVFQIKRRTSLSGLNRNSFISLDTCKIVVEETSTFMVNFFSYSHELRNLDLIVTTADERKQNVKLNNELPSLFHFTSSCPRHNKGERELELFQRFKLQPNTYVFSLEFRSSKQDSNKEELNFLMKICSISKCTFKELHLKPKQVGICTIL